MSDNWEVAVCPTVEEKIIYSVDLVLARQSAKASTVKSEAVEIADIRNRKVTDVTQSVD